MERNRIAIVIPAYNEENTIAEVVSSVLNLATVIVVSDNSTDKTAKLAKDAGAIVVELEANKGYEGAIEHGFKHAQALNCDYVVTMDADGQHTKESLEKIINLLKSGKYDLVLGFRPQSARFSETLFCHYFKLRFGVHDALCGMKGYHIKYFNNYNKFDSRKLVGTELLLYALKNKAKFTQIPIEIRMRNGDSRYGDFLKRILRY